MNSKRSAWMMAASIAAVSALKDQGLICGKWNYPLKWVQHHTKSNFRSYSQASNKLSSSTSNAISNRIKDEQLKQSEESFKQVLYLNCWGPN